MRKVRHEEAGRAGLWRLEEENDRGTSRASGRGRCWSSPRANITSGALRQSEPALPSCLSFLSFSMWPSAPGVERAASTSTILSPSLTCSYLTSTPRLRERERGREREREREVRRALAHQTGVDKKMFGRRRFQLGKKEGMHLRAMAILPTCTTRSSSAPLDPRTR